MAIPLEKKADLIHAAILEDRAEVRILKDRISQTVTLLATASFAVSAYVIGKVAVQFVIVMDIGFVALLLVAVWALKRDLLGARLCLEFREDMLTELATTGAAPLNIYESVGRTHAFESPHSPTGGLVATHPGVSAWPGRSIQEARTSRRRVSREVGREIRLSSASLPMGSLEVTDCWLQRTPPEPILLGMSGQW